MDEDSELIFAVVFDFLNGVCLGHVSGGLHVVERQGFFGVHSGNLLAHGSQEALGVEEACESKNIWPPASEPLVELSVPVSESGEPVSQGVI